MAAPHILLGPTFSRRVLSYCIGMRGDVSPLGSFVLCAALAEDAEIDLFRARRLYTTKEVAVDLVVEDLLVNGISFFVAPHNARRFVPAKIPKRCTDEEAELLLYPTRVELPTISPKDKIALKVRNLRNSERTIAFSLLGVGTERPTPPTIDSSDA